MKLYKKTCKNPGCGKEFMGTKTQQYCCPDCRRSKREEEKPKKNLTLSEIAKKAKENGISYGRYVAIQYLNQGGR